MRIATSFCRCAAAVFAAATLGAADVREGLVSYWPLDAVNDFTFTTPDVVSGNDFVLSFTMSSANLATGKRGNALRFDGATGGDYLIFDPFLDANSLLPISLRPNWTVMFWVNADFTGQNDRRVFSESSLSDNNPLVNIGTHNANPPADGTVDIYMRGGTAVNHAHSNQTAYDGQWHHVALAYDGADLQLYVDGAADLTIPYPSGSDQVNVTTIGAIVREDENNIAAQFTGLVDDVAVWERALSQDEVAQVMNDGIQTPVPDFAPSIVSQPVGHENAREGQRLTLEVAAVGTRPFTYQWKRNGANLPGATGETFEIAAATPGDSGDYTVEVQNSAGAVTSEPATVSVSPFSPDDLVQGLVAYWPLDEVQGTKTPDLVNAYDLNLENLTAADLVSGQKGNAFQFENARQTVLYRVHEPGEDLPINQHESFTISMWANVDGVGQNDLRLFSEGNTGNSDPLFNLGTDNGGGSAALDVFIRQSGWTTVNHLHSTLEPLDGTWHHIVFVQEEGRRTLFVDGVEDTDLEMPDKPTGAFNVNDTTVGGILRSSFTHWVTGLIDEVALWKRALSPLEIEELASNGVPDVGPVLLPLEIQSFDSEYPAVAAGGETTLRWEASKDATLSIEPGIGDVTALSDFGVGATEVTVDGTTTYTLTATRGGESVSATATVVATPNVASGWRLVENFESYPAGPIADASAWLNPEGAAAVVNLGLNKVLGFDGGNDLNALPLRSMTLKEGERATLFFRVYSSSEDVDSSIGLNVGLSEKPVRFVGDFDDDVGPYVRIDRSVADTPADILARFGPGLEYDVPFVPAPIVADQVYNVWLDIENGPLNAFDTGDTFSVHVAAEGDNSRSTIFQSYTGDRNPEGSPDLGAPKADLSLLLAAAIGGGQGAYTVFLDDFYLSATGAFQSSVPIPAASFDRVEAPSMLGIARAGGQVEITFDGGTLESADSVTGPWTPVPNANPPSFQVTPSDSMKFYRASQ